ncbi:bifunctional nicotinamide mononucleotide adenylyltransferase/ADP-ribose pyrophosphatase [Marinomonas spartinae]|uniref:Bifunctional nicotinamide mononucleotide adenylyltransferase/ADP-ribose pyrophosphatase n=1 Tax=Marinomonas spartinae TaxID=1792290 RepID=A0A1A8T981_9GAMM|nr:NUDIX domain-containing protein [Marinomonas spartinae]SBS28144.1 bifunctional nicotinamide mononucleotide adenylyltransferase/ADP-ribose pyrophosphatase [Marinomonas spartinae]
MQETEAEFLKKYDRREYLAPLMTVDAAIFTFHGGKLLVLLTERCEHPEKGKWALPGGFVDEEKDASLEEAIQRKLQEKTGVKAPYIEQLISVGNNQRDARGWSVTVVYTALVALQSCQSFVDNVSDVRWEMYEEALKMDLAFDHIEIMKAARERLKQKALYSMVPAYALPEEFTLPELQHCLEVLIDKPIQKKSFRRRVEQADLMEEVGLRSADKKGRPSMAYRLKEGVKDFTFIRNLDA